MSFRIGAWGRNILWGGNGITKIKSGAEKGEWAVNLSGKGVDGAFEAVQQTNGPKHKFFEDYRKEAEEASKNHRQLNDFYKVTSGGRNLDLDVETGFVSDRSMSTKDRINAAFNLAGPALFTSSPQSFVSTATTKGRVFWSGGRDVAGKAAQEYAKAKGMTTLEMTNVGKILEKIEQVVPYKYTKPFWDLASSRFAKGATGEVPVFQNINGVSLESTWKRIEYDILKSNDVKLDYFLVKP